jgi:hypothetical protein
MAPGLHMQMQHSQDVCTKKVMYMYVTQHENMKKYFNMTSSQPDQLQHKSFQYVTCSWTATSVKQKYRATILKG